MNNEPLRLDCNCARPCRRSLVVTGPQECTELVESEHYRRVPKNNDDLSKLGGFWGLWNNASECLCLVSMNNKDTHLRRSRNSKSTESEHYQRVPTKTTMTVATGVWPNYNELTVTSQ